MKRKTIAVFGGTFNPIHLGHSQILCELEKLNFIDRIFLIPTKIPPHKQVGLLADEKHRLAMCEIIGQKFSKVSVCKLELRREGKSYTVDTLLALKEQYPDHDFALTIGGDMTVTFHQWKDYRTILRNAVILPIGRCGVDPQLFDQAVDRLRKDGGDVRVIPADILNISSTYIRENARNMEAIRPYLDPDVAAYIVNNGLYGDKMDYEEYKAILQARLNSDRYAHSLCVADEARRLAVKYGADSEKAYLAGLLHDITKNDPPEEHLKIFSQFGIILNDLEKNAFKLWHAMSGAAYVQGVLKIDDPEIVSAIRYHTTAKKDMTLLEKVLYIADFTSADRDYEDVDVMRRLADESLTDAMAYSLTYTIGELQRYQSPVHPDTLEAYNQVMMEKKSEEKQ